MCSGVTWWHGAPVSSSPLPGKGSGTMYSWRQSLLSDGCLIQHVPAGLYKYATTWSDICLEVLVYNVHVGNGETGRQ